MQLGRYQVLKELATGSIADVLLARASGLEGFARHVVIKRIQPELVREERFVSAFLEEARISASLHHQNIVQVHDIGDEGGSIYFAMEYVHGEDCRKLVNKVRELRAQMPLQHVMAIVMATAAGLHYAHEQVVSTTGENKGIIHRDISPANILIGYDGSVKLVDFGLAKAVSRSTNATQSGTLKGKSSYMSPEQCMGRPIDRRTDIFSLGIVMYELLTAQRLFKGPNEFLTMGAIVDGEIPLPSSLRADLPPALDEIVMHALARPVESRYQTAEALRESLEAFAVAHELRTSHKALADYLVSLFGEKQEPWLVDADEAAAEAAAAQLKAWKELESSHDGLVRSPRNPRDVAQRFTTQESPIALARSLGASDDWGDEADENESTSGQLPSLRRTPLPTEPTQTMRKSESRPAVVPAPAGRRNTPAVGLPPRTTTPAAGVQAPRTTPPGGVPPRRTTPAAGVNPNVRPRPSEPPATTSPVRSRQSEPPPSEPPPTLRPGESPPHEVTAVLAAHDAIRALDTTATGRAAKTKTDVTSTKTNPRADAPASTTLVEAPIFDASVAPEDLDDDGLDEDEPATEIALDVPVHVPGLLSPPTVAPRKPIRGDQSGVELPRAPDVVPQPLRAASRVAMPGSPTAAGMGVGVPREATPQKSPPAGFMVTVPGHAPGPGANPPQQPSFAGVDPAAVAKGFAQQPRAPELNVETPADVNLTSGRSRSLVVVLVAAALAIGIGVIAAKGCEPAAAPAAAPADAESEDAPSEPAHDAAVRARDAGPRDAGVRDASPRDADVRDAAASDAGAHDAGTKKQPIHRPWHRPKGK